MNKRILPLFGLCLVFVFSLCTTRPLRAQGYDEILLQEGSAKGKVLSMTPYSIKISKGALDQEVAVNKVRGIRFDREPNALTTARDSILNIDYQKALEELRKIKLAEIRRPEIKQDVAFYMAYCKARMAIAGSGDPRKAGGELNTFVKNNKKSFHYLAGVETLGDLLVVMGNHAGAAKQYAILANAPWPDYKIRSLVLQGRALATEKKFPQAMEKFDSALSIKANSKAELQQQLEATLGKAFCLSETGKVKEAISMVEKVIAQAEPEATTLHAQAYLTLGKSNLKQGKKKEALLDFLHVDILYSSVPTAHSEALYHMIPLWEELGQGERARKAKIMLQERYPSSSWAKRLK